MPGLDQSGPLGQGPMTGRRLGRCTNYGASQGKRNAAHSEGQDQTRIDDLKGRIMSYGFWRGRGNRGRGRKMGGQNRLRGV